MAESLDGIGVVTSEPSASARLPEWVQIGQWADAASSLEHLSMSLRLVTESPQERKWAIIACHSALQGALIQHINIFAL